MEAEALGTAEEQKRKKKKRACIVQTPQPRRLIKAHFRVTGAWGRAIPSNPATVARSEHGEKGGVIIEASRLVRVPLFSAPSYPRAPLKFRIPRNPGFPTGNRAQDLTLPHDTQHMRLPVQSTTF